LKINAEDANQAVKQSSIFAALNWLQKNTGRGTMMFEGYCTSRYRRTELTWEESRTEVQTHHIISTYWNQLEAEINDQNRPGNTLQSAEHFVTRMQKSVIINSCVLVRRVLGE